MAIHSRLFSLPPNAVLFPALPILFAAYHYSLRVHISKSLAAFSSVVALMSIFGNYAACFDAPRNPSLGADSYTLQYALFHLGLGVLAALLLFYPLRKYGSRLIDQLDLNAIWYSTIPFSALFLGINLALRPVKYETYRVNNVYASVLVTLTALLILYISLHIVFYFIVTELFKAAKAQERGRLLEMQESQFLAQQRYLEADAKARHDFRQALRTLKELANANDFDALWEFLNRYEQSLPENDAKTYCRHYALNALLNYYVRLADQTHIRTEIKIELPEALRLSETDLCGMVGNILENAVAACQEVPEDERTLLFKTRAPNNSFIIVAVNAFGDAVRMKNGTYLSTRRRGRGLGLSSIRSTAEKYGGSADFHHDGTAFYTDILIPIFEEESPPPLKN